jgi:hypothetical protein
MRLSHAVSLIESQARNLTSDDEMTRATACEAVRQIIHAYAETVASKLAAAYVEQACITYAEAHAGEIVAQRRAALEAVTP